MRRFKSKGSFLESLWDSSDVWWVSYGLPSERSEKHISFTFTLKAATQLGRAREEIRKDILHLLLLLLLLSSLVCPVRTLIVISPLRAFSSNIHLKTLSLRLSPGSGPAWSLVWYLENICISLFVVRICQYQQASLNNTFTFQVRQRGIMIEIEQYQ